MTIHSLRLLEYSRRTHFFYCLLHKSLPQFVTRNYRVGQKDLPGSPPQSPAAPLLSQVFKSSGLTHFFPTIIYIFLFTHWYCACCRVFGVLPCRFLSSTITQSGLIEPEVEMQLSRYHRFRGCSFSVVDFAKKFPYRRVLYTRYQESES